MPSSEAKPQRVPGGKMEWQATPVLLAANPEFNEEELRKLIENGAKTAATGSLLSSSCRT
jgi:hypothetical protein